MREIRDLKRAIRRRIIGQRDAIEPETRREHSREIVRRLMRRPEMRGAHTVHLFASFGSEVDTTPLIELLLGSGRRVVLPVVRGGWTMEHAAISSTDDLRPGFKSIREPCPRCRRVAPRAIDLVIVPGVAFDRTGGRLGYGGGFYDVFLAVCPAPRIALAFSIQIIDEVPCGVGDLPVDLVITEREVIRSKRGRSRGRP